MYNFKCQTASPIFLPLFIYHNTYIPESSRALNSVEGYENKKQKNQKSNNIHCKMHPTASFTSWNNIEPSTIRKYIGHFYSPQAISLKRKCRKCIKIHSNAWKRGNQYGNIHCMRTTHEIKQRRKKKRNAVPALSLNKGIKAHWNTETDNVQQTDTLQTEGKKKFFFLIKIQTKRDGMRRIRISILLLYLSEILLTLYILWPKRNTKTGLAYAASNFINRIGLALNYMIAYRIAIAYSSWLWPLCYSCILVIFKTLPE